MIKQDELKKLKNAEKIELVTLNKVKGFTPDMVETIVNRLIEAFNNNEEEEFTIKVNNFKMTVYADKLNYINLLDKFHARIKVAAENKLYTDFKAYLNNTLIKTNDNYITDGSIMLNHKSANTRMAIAMPQITVETVLRFFSTFVRSSSGNTLV